MNINFISNIFKRNDVLAFLCCILFFKLWPNFDIGISQFFYDSEQSGFYLKDHPLAIFIYDITHYVGITILVVFLTSTVVTLSSSKNRLRLYRKSSVYLLTSALLGPIIIVDTVLKHHWERPRPRQTLDFGGSYTFEPPFSPTFTCQSCRSFVSGHASVGFYLFCFGLLWRKKRWLLYAVIFGGIIGMTRIVQGGHFFSDIIFSGWSVWFGSLLLYKLFYKYNFLKKILQ